MCLWKKPQIFPAEGLELVLPVNLITIESVPGGSALTGTGLMRKDSDNVFVYYLSTGLFIQLQLSIFLPCYIEQRALEQIISVLQCETM